MSLCLEDIHRDLEAEQDRLDKQVQSLQQELRDLEHQRKRVTAALKALAVNPLSKPAQRKPSASKAEVIAVLTETLEQRGPLQEQELRKAVEQRIVEAGKSRMGLALRLKEALSTRHFVTTTDGRRSIAEKGATAANDSSASISRSGSTTE